MPAFLAEGMAAADLARVQQTQPFLLLLNGWNEISESNSAQANAKLRELERDFPSAGIIVATRTHHLTPPLPGALRLRLLPLRRAQRAAYLLARLGDRGAGLRARIEADVTLDELTLTPFTLSAVASLFEADAEIPTTRLGVLAQVVRLQEQRDEHRNALEAAPIFGRATDYLKGIATRMACRGAAALPRADGRATVAAVARELAGQGQTEAVEAPTILATLAAHHVLELVDYPHAGVRFEHQQLQEYFAALDIRDQLLNLKDDDRDSISRFTAEYVNQPVWAEPLRMVAETFSDRSGDDEADTRNTLAGARLLKMALSVDLVFTGELARLCGSTVWSEVGAFVAERARAVYAASGGSYRQHAMAAMLATGAEAFSDIIVPLLSGEDQQTRLSTYGAWPDMRVSSLGGTTWRQQVQGWSEQARADFVSEVLYHRIDDDVASFAVEDRSTAVKRAAASSLMWNESEDALTRVLDSMDVQTFDDVVRENADLMPPALRPQTVAAMHRFIEVSADPAARLRTTLHLVEFGEDDLDAVVKDTLTSLAGRDIGNLEPRYIRPALEYLRTRDPAWASEWVAVRIAEGVLYEYESWLRLVTTVPKELAARYLRRLETEDFSRAGYAGRIAVIATCADVETAARLFAQIRKQYHRMHAATQQRREFEWQVMRQLEAVFRGLPDDVGVAGVMSMVAEDDPLDIEVAARLLSRVARPDVEPLRVTDGDLKAALRAYLKDGVDLVLRQDDFRGEGKANLASSIAQVGEAGDMADLMVLIRADIERMRRGQAALAAGDRGPLGSGGRWSYARWHIASVVHLDPAGAEQALIGLLAEREYRSDAAAAMADDYVRKPHGHLDTAFRYDLLWAAREGRNAWADNDQRRRRFAGALSAETERLRRQHGDATPVVDLMDLARALAALEGRGFAALVLEVIAMPGHLRQYSRLDAVERLLTAGVVLPARTVLALADSWLQHSDRGLLRRILALCPFVDDPVAGIAKEGVRN